MSSTADEPPTEDVNATQNTNADESLNADRPPLRRRSSISSFILASFIIFMLMNNRGDEMLVRNRYIETLASSTYQLSNYSAWLNGTASNFSLPVEQPSTTELAESLIAFGSRLDPLKASYYSNLTGFWHGELQLQNLTSVDSSEPIPTWRHLADAFVSKLNKSALPERLGDWNWTRSTKVSMSLGDKLSSIDQASEPLHEDIATIHGKLELTDSLSSEDMRLDFDGVHFLENGTIYAFAERTGRPMDIRLLPSIVPEPYLNVTARVIETELVARVLKLKEKIDAGILDSEILNSDDNPKTSCSFHFYGQVEASEVPQHSMKELEDEINEPTGITTIQPPPLIINGVLVSVDCGMVLHITHATGLKSPTLFRKMTTYAGVSTLVYMLMLVLLTRQVAKSSSAAGLSRVSRYTFLTQSLIDAIAFVGHVTLAVLADGRPSLAVLAPAGFACILFIYEAQFSVLVGQIQAPEDVVPPPSPTPAAPQPAAATTSPTNATDGQPNPPTPVASPPQPPSFLRFLWTHIRTDPSARLWTIMSLFLIVVFRVVIVLSLPLFFIGSLYSSIWFFQIYRSVRRARSSGLSTEYLIGMSLCRLYFVLYFLGCPENILDVEPRPWIYGVAAFMFVQVTIITLQESFSPTFFLLRRMAQAQTYNYHPPLPMPDSESPEQSYGDCAICMDAIQIYPAQRHRSKSSDGKDHQDSHTHSGGILGAVGVVGSQKNYSLAPCHHLFHTACLERWLAIKNICPQCRRPLPPL